MAVNQGVAPLSPILTVSGTSFPIINGVVTQNAERQSSQYWADVAMEYPGALVMAATATDAAISISCVAGSGELVSGPLDTVEVDFIGTTIRFTGRDDSAKLNDNKSAEKWTNQQGSDIVQDLVGRATGLSVDAETSSLLAGKLTKDDYARVTDGISFASVIHKLAELDGARWWVKNGTFFYRSSGSSSGVYTLNYSYPDYIISDCLSLRVTRNVQADRPANVTVSAWHPKKKQVFTGTANGGSGNGSPINYVFRAANLLQDHVDAYANSKLNEITRHAVTIEAEVVGDPSIDVAMGLQLNGTDIWDGQYEIDVIRHEFGMNGYTMTITSKSPGQGS